MIIKKDLLTLKQNGNKLEKKVINILLSKGNTEEIENYLKNIITYGCISGLVEELYYNTLEFYKKYQREIKQLTKDKIPDPNDIKSITWFAVEEICQNIALQLKVEF